MPYRDSDHAQLPNGKEPVIKFTREIPLPWLLGVLGSAVALGSSLLVGIVLINQKQSDQGNKQSEIGAEVKSINDKLNRSEVVGAEVKFKLDDLSRRVTVIEAKQPTK